jgi:uncharacterized protein YneF (UPF0154 family)
MKLDITNTTIEQLLLILGYSVALIWCCISIFFVVKKIIKKRNGNKTSN